MSAQPCSHDLVEVEQTVIVRRMFRRPTAGGRSEFVEDGDGYQNTVVRCVGCNAVLRDWEDGKLMAVVLGGGQAGG